MAPGATERELKDKAHGLMAKGALERALEIFKQLITLNSRDASYRLRHAELCARLDRVQAAVGSYRVAAHLFAEAGRLAQARAALHRAMQLDPKDMAVRRAAATLVEQPAPESAPTKPAPVFLGRDELPTEPGLPALFG